MVVEGLLLEADRARNVGRFLLTLKGLFRPPAQELTRKRIAIDLAASTLLYSLPLEVRLSAPSHRPMDERVVVMPPMPWQQSMLTRRVAALPCASGRSRENFLHSRSYPLQHPPFALTAMAQARRPVPAVRHLVRLRSLLSASWTFALGAHGRVRTWIDWS